MKALKYIFVLILILFLNLSAKADVIPLYTGVINKAAIGFLQVPQNFNLHLYPRIDSEIVETVNWTDTEIDYSKTVAEPHRFFAVRIQSKNIAFCTVVDMQDNWYKIVYDKLYNKTAWIKVDKEDDFWGLKDFYSYFGRRYGLYYMKNIDYRKRGIYSGAELTSQKLGGFTLIKSIKLNKLSGNWALVTITDLDKLPKIGYIQWRESDGTIILFPKFTTSY